MPAFQKQNAALNLLIPTTIYVGFGAKALDEGDYGVTNCAVDGRRVGI